MLLFLYFFNIIQLLKISFFSFCTVFSRIQSYDLYIQDVFVKSTSFKFSFFYFIYLMFIGFILELIFLVYFQLMISIELFFFFSTFFYFGSFLFYLLMMRRLSIYLISFLW